MAAKDAINKQQFGQATAAIEHLVQSDPETYWRVSPPQQGARVSRLRGGWAAYRLRGGRSTKADKVDVGGLAAEPGSKGIARQALQRADEDYPTRRQTLDAFDGRLTGIYSHLGFRETHRVPFDEKYAPPGWKPEYGKPDVVFMEREAAQPALFHMQRQGRARERARQMQNELAMKTGQGFEQQRLF